MPKTENLDSYASSYTAEFPFYEEEEILHSAYAGRIVASLRGRQGLRVLSMGLGSCIVASALLDQLAGRIQEYVVLEGSKSLISKYKDKLSVYDTVETVHTHFEDFDTEKKYDVIEMGFILEHVDDPELIVSRFKRFLADNGRMYLSVPNARSLHRLLGHSAGLLDNLYRLSDYDLQLGHKRYYDLSSFCKLVLDSGLKICRTEGLMLKPFTAGQLTQLGLGPEVGQALLDVGIDYPDICNAVLVEAAG